MVGLVYAHNQYPFTYTIKPSYQLVCLPSVITYHFVLPK